MVDVNGDRKPNPQNASCKSTTYYIKALLGARTSNIAFVYDGLKQAIKLDPSMAKKAAGDLEFAKYLQDATFQTIIK